MRPAPNKSTARDRARKAGRSLTAYWLLWAVVLLGNAIGSYFLVTNSGSESGDSSLPPIPLDGVAQVEAPAGTGSGFLVGSDLLLTAAHVVGAVGNPIRVVFEDGSSVGGEVVASGYPEYEGFQIDATTVREGATPHDWAVVRLDQSQGLSKALYLGDSSLLTEGDPVLAVGYPGGGQRNVSAGVVAGKGEGVLRTDAPIDPGHSGGPLISEAQEAVVGILVSVPNIQGRPSMSVRMAVPIELVIQKAAQAGVRLE